MIMDRNEISLRIIGKNGDAGSPDKPGGLSI